MDYEIGNSLPANPDKQFKWRFYQKDVIKQMRTRNKVCGVMARQTGKTEIGIQLLQDFIFKYKKRRNPIAFVAMETASQAFNVYFSRLHNVLQHLPPSVYMKRGTKDTHITIYFKRPHIGDTATIRFMGVGNRDALRGDTLDFLIMDEAAQYPPDTWTSIFRPMLDHTEGKALITSTPEGDNFDRMLAFFKEKSEEKDSQYGYFRVDIVQSKTKSKQWLRDTIQEAKALGKYHKFLQEYMCDSSAAPPEEAPFSNKVAALHEENGYLTEHEKFLAEEGDLIYVSVDIGAAGNTAAWAWRPSVYGYLSVTNYDDSFSSLRDLIDQTFRTYSAKFFKTIIIFPNDVEQPSLLEGRTRLQVLRDYMMKKGYGTKMSFKVLPKVKIKETVWNEGLDNFRNMKFNEDTCRIGLDKLRKVRFIKNKTTEVITYGKTVNNGAQHAGDALLYITSALRENVSSLPGGIDCSSYRVNTPLAAGYTGPKGKRYAQ